MKGLFMAIGALAGAIIGGAMAPEEKGGSQKPEETKPPEKPENKGKNGDEGGAPKD